MRAVDAIMECLKAEGVDAVFGIPGGANLPTYDAIYDAGIRHILCKHEQGAGHAAEGYAKASGKVGVALATSGPGATNLITAITDAMMDSVPTVFITGQVRTDLLGTDGFQEADMIGISMPVVKHSFQALDPREIPHLIHEAFHVARTGRPGPVLVDIPKDIVDPRNPRSAMDWYWPEKVDLPGYHPVTTGDPAMIRRAAELILASERPVIYAGGGILKARAAEALRELAERCDIHVVTTLMARGAFPDDHPLCLGMPGMHGNYTAVTSMQQSDLLIALGSRFDDRVTGKVDAFAPDAKIIHVDIDPAELGKVRRPDAGIAGDCRLVIEELIVAIDDLGGPEAQPDRTTWKSTISGWCETFPLTYEMSEPGELLKPQFVLETLRDNTPDDCIVASGVGQHQMWASQHWKFNHPYTWVNSGGLGTMGFAVPAAIGAKVGRPDRMVWAVDGDGCFQMTAQELVTAASERIPVKIAILNNAYLGMVRQWQEMFYEERYSEVYLSPDLPDYKMWAEAMGCVGMRVESPEDVLPAIQRANEIDDRPVVIDFRTDAREKVYPMVPSGLGNSEIVVDPTQGSGGR